MSFQIDGKVEKKIRAWVDRSIVALKKYFEIDFQKIIYWFKYWVTKLHIFEQFRYYIKV